MCRMGNIIEPNLATIISAAACVERPLSGALSSVVKDRYWGAQRTSGCGPVADRPASHRFAADVRLFRLSPVEGFHGNSGRARSPAPAEAMTAANAEMRAASTMHHVATQPERLTAG